MRLLSVRPLSALAVAGCLVVGVAIVTCGGNGGSNPGDGTPSGEQGSHFFLPTRPGDNTTSPSLAVDSSGGLHSVYPAYAKGGAYYTYCANGCQSADDVKVVHFETDTTVDNVMLALDSKSRPRVLLSTFAKVFYATCDTGCTDLKSWTVTEILDHERKKAVSGSGFALDKAGRPRFILHTHVTYLGIGQGAPLTEYVACDTDCHRPSSWKAYKVAEQIWYRPELRFDAQDHPLVAAVATIQDGSGYTNEYGIYAECRGDCTQEEAWQGVAITQVYSNESEAVSIKPSVSLALAPNGAPRMLALARGSDGSKQIMYFACDSGCTAEDKWTGFTVSSNAKLSDGIDLALDAQGRPRFAYSLNYSITLARCDSERCEQPGAKWEPSIIEDANKMKPDEIFLYRNCNVSAWFLHAPSLVLTPDGGMRVGYQARDVSGGWVKKDPTGPDCVAGTDMTWSRLAIINK